MIILAVGTGRCGTKTFAQLACDAGADSIHEPSPRLEPLAAEFAMGPAAGATAAGVLEQVVEKLHEIRGGRVDRHENYCESAHWYSWLIPAVRQLWPSAFVVLLTRQLDGFAKSAFRRGWYDKDTELYFHNHAEISTARFMPKRGWPPNADRWFKLAWMWYTVHHRACEDLRASGLNWAEFPCEELSNLERVAGLFDWIGLRPPPLDAWPVSHRNAGLEYRTIAEIRRAGIPVEGDIQSEFTLVDRVKSHLTEEIPLWFGDISERERQASLMDGLNYASYTFGRAVVPELAE